MLYLIVSITTYNCYWHFCCFQFIFEGMEESGSEGLDELVFAKKDTFLKVPFVLCIYYCEFVIPYYKFSGNIPHIVMPNLTADFYHKDHKKDCHWKLLHNIVTMILLLTCIYRMLTMSASQTITGLARRSPASRTA